MERKKQTQLFNDFLFGLVRGFYVIIMREKVNYAANRYAVKNLEREA